MLAREMGQYYVLTYLQRVMQSLKILLYKYCKTVAPKKRSRSDKLSPWIKIGYTLQ